MLLLLLLTSLDRFNPIAKPEFRFVTMFAAAFMASNDPSETGGLFIGRRPGTAPVRHRARPVTAGAARRRFDSVIAFSILALEMFLCATLWGPQPAGWLWVGSQVDYATSNVVVGIVAAFAGMLSTILATLAVTMRLDRVWKLVRRAAGHEQKRGALERIFLISILVGGTAFAAWLLVIHGPGKVI
jgi:hypothetical protein